MFDIDVVFIPIDDSHDGIYIGRLCLLLLILILFYATLLGWLIFGQGNCV